jgi:hypothetical protein
VGAPPRRSRNWRKNLAENCSPRSHGDRDLIRGQLHIAAPAIYSLITPARNRITTTMTITPMIPTPPHSWW